MLCFTKKYVTCCVCYELKKDFTKCTKCKSSYVCSSCIVNMIEGIIITPLKQIVDERGKIMHMLRRDSNVFKSFGEIYFSTVNPKFIKAWHKHKEATLNYACIKGKVKFVLFDDRKGSETFAD